MPDSQRQRPGAKLVPSHEEKVRDLLQRAKTLESELSTAGKSDEEKAAQLRSHLCEVISDLIITDPAVSREYDLPTTLWRSCFYFPICSFRKEMSKMKRKKGPTSSTRAFENQFKKFLSEALALYDYLSIQYQSKLIPGHTQVDSQEDAQVPTESESTAGVVEGLYRLFIYTGDLHRYAESFDKATACYQNASKLSPGNGNPYNQLAVVSQMKDPLLCMNALYWYCRSLLATHSSFETSGNNLERLFTSNREHLQEHSRGGPPIFVADKKNPLSNAQKQAATKSCLSHFVDFHFDILREANETDLRVKLAGIFQSLESLLDVSAFSDPLLFKVVIINAFGIEKASTGTRRQIVREFMIQLGRSFLDRLIVTMSKILEKPNDPRQLSTIRLLLPLLIIVELMARDDGLADEGEFWQKVSTVGTLVQKYCLQMDSINDQVEPEDYRTLKGYQPFAFLTPDYATGSPFITEDEVIRVLDLQSTQSQRVDTRNEETKARMAQFVRLCTYCSTQDSIPIQIEGTSYVFRSAAEERFTPDDLDVVGDQTVDHAVGRLPVDMETDPYDDGGDVVIDISPTTSAPVAASSTALPLNFGRDGNNMLNAEGTVHVGEDIPQPPPPALLPPPGFGFPALTLHATTTTTTTTPGLAVEAADHSVPSYPSQQMDDMHFQWPNGYGQPEPKASNNFLTPGYEGRNCPSYAGIQPGDFLSEILLPTQNPFATSVPRIDPTTTNNNTNSTNNWMYPQFEADPVSDMLGSGLLESLFMTDPPRRESRNPFAS